MRWHIDRSPPSPEFSVIIKNFLAAQEEKRNEPDSDEEGSQEDLVNSDNEAEDGPNYNEIDENDLEADFDEEMGSSNDSEDEDEEEMGSSNDSDNEEHSNDEEENYTDDDAMDVY